MAADCRLRAMPEPRFRPVTTLRGHRPGDPGAVLLDLDGAAASLAISRDGSVRLRAAPFALPPDNAEAVGFLPWRPSPAEPFVEDDGRVLLAFDGPEGAASAVIAPEPFAVQVRDREGRALATLSGLAFEPGGRARIALDAHPSEHFFGFGEKTGRLDKRGARLRMRCRDANVQLDSDPLYVSIPFFLGFRHEARLPQARGVLLHALAPSRFDVASTDPGQVEMETLAGGIDVTVFPGPSPADVLRRFTARVGRTPLPPLWALGHHQSRWSYRTQREVRALAREFRRRKIPTDVIHLDIDYMDGYRVFTWDARRFPQPKRLLQELAAEGFRIVTIIDPGVKVDPGYSVFREGRGKDVFCRRDDRSLYTLRVWPGNAALPDFNRPEVRQWWGEQHEPLLASGVAGIWNDMNEPAGWDKDVRLGRLMIPYRFQDTTRLRQADPVDPTESVPHEHVRNIYGQQECRATRSWLEAAAPERRAFVLSRSGYAGIQRFAALWTGDNASRWSQLRISLPMLMNLSLSGVAFCGADIGGFAWNCTPELYARWIQIGALYPFARTHSMLWARRQEPWRFGRRVEAIARRALELRMRLLPYLYGLFRESERTGAPVWRPLFYEFPEDEGSVGVDDQVMVGPALLAAPVLEKGARAREVYLPPGVWISWDDDARYTGPRRMRILAPLERIPLFVRGGAVLPTRSPTRHVGETPSEPLVLEVFPGGDWETEVVEDDGETFEYRSGGFARTALRVRDRAGGRLRLELGPREGSYALANRRVRAVFHAALTPRQLYLDARPLARGTALPGFSDGDGRVEVWFEDDGHARSIELDPAP
jgi:alpha-glucosidase